MKRLIEKLNEVSNGKPIVEFLESHLLYPIDIEKVVDGEINIKFGYPVINGRQYTACEILKKVDRKNYWYAYEDIIDELIERGEIIRIDDRGAPKYYWRESVELFLNDNESQFRQ